MHLDQVELEPGTPRSEPPGYSVNCGKGAFVRAVGNVGVVDVFIPPVKSAIVPIERTPERRLPLPNGCEDTASCLDVAVQVEIRSFELADPCVPSIPCPADLNRHGVVGGTDLVMLLGDWGACADCPSALNGDGNTNAQDIGMLLALWTD